MHIINLLTTFVRRRYAVVFLRNLPSEMMRVCLCDYLLSGNGEYNLWVGLLGRPPRDYAIPWAGPGTQSPLAVRYGAVWLGGA